MKMFKAKNMNKNEPTKETEIRTPKQNDSLHLYFEHLAETLNLAGLDVRAVLKPDVEIPWSKVMVKELLWRPIQKIYLNKKSTTRLTRNEVNEVYKILDRHLIQKFGVLVDFPSLDGLINENHTARKNLTAPRK